MPKIPPDAETQILGWIRSSLVQPGREIDENSPLFSSRILDSMKLAELLAGLEHRFGVRLGAMDLIPENLDTVARIVACLRRKSGGA